MFGLIAVLSESKELASSRDFIVPVVALLFLASAVAMAGLSQSLHVKPSDQRKLLFVIVCFAVGLRAVAMLTPPILEIDYYRYLWDGKVSSIGVSPYAYSPAQVLDANTTNDDSDYQSVVSLSIDSESNLAILSSIHFPDFTTVYPPVSQLVFATAMKWFPDSASVTAHLLWMKFILILFDVATIIVLVKLLLLLRRSLGWLIVYAWNPLVIKEIANSAHLDSIAVFFTTAAVYFMTLCLAKQARPLTRWALLSGLCLGLGFGAKLFPIVLAPMFVVVFAKVRQSTASCFTLAMFVTVAGIFWVHSQAMSDRSIAQHYFNESSSNEASSEGLASFLSQWRMNDVVFSGIYRNLRPDSESGSVPWFVFTSNDLRQGIASWCQQRSFGADNPAFLLTRLVTMAAFSVFYASVLLSTFRSSRPLQIERFAWVMAVFLFLQPTVNPWYWVWVTPLACFVNNKAWLLVSGLLSIYYLRFWFQTFQGSYLFGGTAYDGVGLFDHGVAWLEFAAILTMAVFCVVQSRKAGFATPKMSR